MTLNQSLFVDALFKCILFDYASRSDLVGNRLTFVELSFAFSHACNLFEYNKNQLNNPSAADFIRQHCLDTPQGIMDYINHPSTNTASQTCHFTYDIAVRLADDKDCGGFGYLSEMEEHHLHVPEFTAAQVEIFQRFYAEIIPTAFHDDLAMLLLGMRKDVWHCAIRDEDVCMLSNGMDAVIKFTKAYNDRRRAASGRKHADKIARSLLIKEAMANMADSIERFVRRMEEQELQIREEGDRKSQEKEHLLRGQKQRKEAEELAWRNTAITEHMNRLYVSQVATPHRRSEVQAIRLAVQKRLRGYYRDCSIEVHSFGSFASGLCDMSSDADLTVFNIPRYLPNRPPIVELANNLRRLRYQHVTSIPHARVPIASFKLYGINCDLSLSQPMGIHNSKLIATYTKIDQRFTTVWFSIKNIATKHGILSASRGFLSSYALTIMLIVFLQDVTIPAILPRLQQSPMATLHTIEGHDCSFDSTTVYDNYGDDNIRSAGELLVDFFYFYGHVFDYSNQVVDPLRGEMMEERSVTPPPRPLDRKPEKWAMCVLDPFIVGRNVAGNCSRESVVTIQGCFRTSYTTLKEGLIEETFLR
ncbi:hypothetical protein BGZ95_007757 [Linnemannia exigua]|uniref:polynucleotide adenylyltransferase n=1 Tax=Linnemannia exigua TaxID=604196 RepID=A0AAD4DES2_9FUNG|nr:hypothetical protein BGZ95_007757 [Linnemannia exigua]